MHSIKVFPTPDIMHFLILKTFSQPQEITSHLNPLDTKYLIWYPKLSISGLIIIPPPMPDIEPNPLAIIMIRK